MRFMKSAVIRYIHHRHAGFCAHGFQQCFTLAAFNGELHKNTLDILFIQIRKRSRHMRQRIVLIGQGIQ